MLYFSSGLILHETTMPTLFYIYYVYIVYALGMLQVTSNTGNHHVNVYTYIYIYIIIYTDKALDSVRAWHSNDPSLGWSTLHTMGQDFQNEGRLGSRYYIYIYMHVFTHTTS